MPRISASSLEEHRAETTDRLLDAFGELVMSQGYSDLSLADVAAQAGIARTAIYNYFPDRETLLFAWTDREVRRTIEALEREVSAASTSEEKLHIFVRQQLIGFATRHLPPGQEVMQLLKPETYKRFMDHIEPVERIAREIIEGGLESGEFGEVNAADTVPMVLACIGAERGPIANKAHDVEEATQRVTSFLLRALAPAKSAPASTPRKKKSARE